MNRRGIFGLTAVALAEIATSRGVAAEKKECVHDHQCGDGKECIDGQCYDRTGTVPCDDDTDCPDDCQCTDGVCTRVEIRDGITVNVPIVVISPRRRRRRRKGGRRRRR